MPSGEESRWKNSVEAKVIRGHGRLGWQAARPYRVSRQMDHKVQRSTAGQRLVLGDIKAVLMHTAGKQTTQEIFESARLAAAVTDNAIDDMRLSRYCT